MRIPRESTYDRQGSVMILTVLDRNDPDVRAAMAYAAAVAELDLSRSMLDWPKEYALDLLAAHTTELLETPSPEKLAWALSFLEKRTDLREHERRLLDDSWEKVIEDAEYERWIQLGE